jgi:hypothetical protein
MNAQQLPITKQQAQAAQVPVLYEQACRSLAECISIDEAVYWGNKADALAAWAKIYKSDEAAVEARRLKLHAYRRMGEIARELRPINRGERKPGRRGFTGSSPGPSSILRESGLNKVQSTSALRLSRIPEETFNALVSQPRPPSPSTIGFARVGASPNYEAYVRQFHSFRALCRNKDPVEYARGFMPDEAKKIRGEATEIIEWLDKFEQHLPRG